MRAMSPCGTGHELYVKQLDAQTGARYNVMHIDEPLTDPDSGQHLGYVAIYTGTVQVTAPGRISKAVLVNSARETLQGDVLIPDVPTSTADFVPHRPARALSGQIIDVIDNGKGLPADQRQKLLEPYMTTREGGTGLGLAIVGKILEDHGGGIELLDRPDGARGARIRLWFPEAGPVKEAEDGEGTVPANGSAPDQNMGNGTRL